MLQYYGNNNRQCALWECECDCGNIKNILSFSLINGLSKSCGCLRIDKNRNEKGQSGFNRLYGQYKKNAKRRNLEFNLTKEEFKNITQQPCYYCGKEPKQECFADYLKKTTTQSKEWSKYIYNGIDRKDNNKGYTIINSVPCCILCNSMKNKLTEIEFKNHIESIYKFNKICQYQ